MKRTVAALVARGVDTETASRWTSDGWTVGKLRGTTTEQLRRLGFSDELSEQLLKGGRPPIPIENATRVLYHNRFQCCVCRDPAKPVILHHVKPWAKSRDHDDSNLAVLCLDHHERAHSVSALAQNLDASALRNLKRQWEAACVEADRISIIGLERTRTEADRTFTPSRLDPPAHRGGDRASQSVLDGKEVEQVAVITLSPGGSVHQL